MCLLLFVHTFVWSDPVLTPFEFPVQMLKLLSMLSVHCEFFFFFPLSGVHSSLPHSRWWLERILVCRLLWQQKGAVLVRTFHSAEFHLQRRIYMKARGRCIELNDLWLDAVLHVHCFCQGRCCLFVEGLPSGWLCWRPQSRWFPRGVARGEIMCQSINHSVKNKARRRSIVEQQ